MQQLSYFNIAHLQSPFFESKENKEKDKNLNHDLLRNLSLMIFFLKKDLLNVGK